MASDPEQPPQPWRKGSYAQAGVVEEVPISWLLRFRGNALGKTDISELMSDIAVNGIREEAILVIGQADRKVALGEGNHRVEAARRLGYTHVPVRIRRQHTVAEYGVVFDCMDRVPKAGYFAGDAAPSAVFNDGVIPKLTAQYKPISAPRSLRL